VEYELSDLATTFHMRSHWPTGPSSTTPTSTATVRHTTRAPRHLALRPDFVI